MVSLMASLLKHKLRHHQVPLTLQPESNPPPNFAVGGQDPCKRFGVRATESWRVSGVAGLAPTAARGVLLYVLDLVPFPDN